jgi:hypothetical protein
VAAFKKLTPKVQPGNQVYIHYSGHGGRASTAFPERKGANGLDEALAPTDIGNSEARYLRDIELAHLLKAMVDIGLPVTIVLDSCHSGGGTRVLCRLASTLLSPHHVLRRALLPDTRIWLRRSKHRQVDDAHCWAPARRCCFRCGQVFQEPTQRVRT